MLTECIEYKRINWLDIVERMMHSAKLFESRSMIYKKNIINTNLNYVE